MYVKAFPVSLCGTTAAREAGYKGPAQESKRLMRKPEIRRAIQEAIAKRAKKYDELAKRVIEHLSHIAFFDQCVAAHVKDGVLSITDTDLLPPEARACIAEISQTRTGIRIKFYDKTKALELLGRHLGLFADNVNVTGTLRAGALDDMTEAEIDAELERLKEKEALARKEAGEGADASSGVHSLCVVDASPADRGAAHAGDLRTNRPRRRQLPGRTIDVPSDSGAVQAR